MCMGVTYRVLCVTFDDYLMILLKSLFLSNKAGNANDRRFPERTDDTLEYSQPAVDGREGCGCWVDCRETLSKIAHYS